MGVKEKNDVGLEKMDVKNNNYLNYYFIDFKYKLKYTISSLIMTAIVYYSKLTSFLFFIIEPLLSTKNPVFEKNNFFIFLNPSEAFFSYFKIIIIFSFITTLPTILIFSYTYLVSSVEASAAQKIKINCAQYLITSIIILVTTLHYLVPNIFSFFLSFELHDENNLLNIQYQPKIKEYVDLESNLIIVLLLTNTSFLILQKQSIITKKLIKYRKYIYFLTLLISSLITPPDIFSQLIMTGFLTFFFELSFFFGIVKKNIWKRQDSNLRRYYQ